MNRLRRVVWLSLVTVLSSHFPAIAQQPAPRIQSAIEASPSVQLPGSLDPHIRSAENLEDLGALSPGTPISGITLVFKRSSAQEADLQQLLAQQADPSSPLYRHWLTPQDFAARFGLADADIAATTLWLQTHGFQVNSVSASRDRITFSGNAAQVQQAFGAELHQYRWQGDLHIAPASDLSLPPELAPITAAVLHLSNFRPKPNAKLPQPHFTTASSQSHMLGPKDIATLYDLGPLYNSGYNGLGQGLAIVGQTFVNTLTSTDTSAIAYFQQYLSQTDPILPVLVPNTGVEAILPGDEVESDVDLEYASAIAPNATIFFVYVGSSPNYDVFDALAFAITQDIAPVISISYGLCEPLMSSTDLAQQNALFEQAAAQGQTIVAASGDTGATACAYASSSTSQQQALAVNFPAGSPYVTAVGGTQMAPGTFTAGSSSYWSPATSSNLTDSLLSYIPEVAWNEDSTTEGLLSSGGGASSTFPRPSWQSGVPGIPSGNFRLVPDVALQASTQSPGFVFCTDEADGDATYNCSSGLLAGDYAVTGGTSFAAPIFAGFVAILNQYEQTEGLGSVNPTLYSLASNPSTYATAFHDITAGTTACSAGDSPCGGAAESVYAATPGYDEATGLGSLDFNQLAAAWPSAPTTSLTPTKMLFSTQPQVNPGDAVQIGIIVDSVYASQVPPVPTGAVSIYLDGQLVEPSLAFTSSDSSDSNAETFYSFTAPSSTGTHLLVARYAGDATHLPTTATGTILVGPVIASGSFSIAANDVSIPSGGTADTEVTITPYYGYNGVLTWSLSAAASTGAPALSACYLIEPARVSGSTQAKLTFGIGAACNSPLPSVSSTPSGILRSSTQPGPRRGPGIPSTLCVALLCALLPLRRHRKPLSLFLLAFAAIAALGLSGCGGGSGVNYNTDYTLHNTYTITLSARDSVNAQLSTFTTFVLTVN